MGRYPALWTFVGLLCGASMALLGVPAVCCAGVALVVYACGFWRCRWVMLAIGTAIILGYCRGVQAIKGADLGLWRSRCSGDVLLEIEALPMTIPATVAEPPSSRGVVMARVLRVRLRGEESYRRKNAVRVAVFFEDNSNFSLDDLAIGDVLLCSDVVFQEILSDRADPRRYLRYRGISWQVRVWKYDRVGVFQGCGVLWRRCLHRVRGHLAGQLIAGVKSPLAVAQLLSIGLGLAEFLPTATSGRLAAAGTLHIFAISGMHVGVVTLMISLVLRSLGLSLRWQWGGTMILAAGYVLLTGAPVSGIRALLMAWCVCYAHFRFRAPCWLNALGVSGSVALIFSPLSCGGLGFIYSYLVVLVLIVLGEAAGTYWSYLKLRQQWLPRRQRRHLLARVPMWWAVSISVSFLAWLASAGVTVCTTGQINFGAPVVNVLLVPLAFVVLCACPIKIIVGLCNAAWGAALGRGVEWLLAVLNFLADYGYESALCRPCRQLSLGWIVAFYAVFAALLWVGYVWCRIFYYDFQEKFRRG